MASTRQLKEHTRFHAAVLRYFFPSSSSPVSDGPQEAPDSNQQASCQVLSPENTEVAFEETHSDNSEAVEAGKVVVSRAQRKRLKLNKLKERQLNSISDQRFVGPLLPDVLEKGDLMLDDEKLADALLQENPNAEQRDLFQSTRDKQGFLEIGKQEVLSGTALEELAMPEREDYTSPCSETREDKDIHVEVEPECLSKAKRRRLAKKRFHDGSRRPTVGSSFMAEIKGEDIIIKQIS